MKKTTKKLFMSSLALTFAAATTISTTYAWFTMQTTAKINQIDINVTGGEGFDIAFGTLASITGGVSTFSRPQDSLFKQTLSYSDLLASLPLSGGGNVFDSLELTHVTSSTGEEFRTLDDTQVIQSFDKAAESNTHYLEFELWFRGQKDYDISLTTLNTYGWSMGSSILANSSITGLNQYTGPMKMVSSGFPSPEEITRFMKDTTTIIDTVEVPDRTKGPVSANDAIYAFSADAARVAFVDNEATAKPTTVMQLTSNGYGAADDTNNLAIEYYNSIYGTNISVTANATPAPATTETVDLAADNVLTTLVSEGTLGYYYSSIRVRVWLEGWDADCFNAIFSDTLHISFGFEGATAA